MIGKREVLLIVSVALLFLMGLIMVYGTSSAEILDDFVSEKGTNAAFIKQLVGGVLGIMVALCCCLLNYHNIIKLSRFLLPFSIFLLVLTFVPGIGLERNGAHRWIALGGVSFQPSEMIKLVLPLFYIDRIRGINPSDLNLRLLFKLLWPLFIPLGLIFLEPDNGTIGLIGLLMIVLFFISGISWKYWLVPVICASLFFCVAAYNIPYVKARISSYMNPEADILGKGHQPYQARIAVGSGRLTGRGLGRSLQKYNYLPEAQNDYIAAIYAEEFGFLGILFLIILYGMIVLLGSNIALSSPSREGGLLAFTVVFLIILQAFLNLGVVSSLLPSTGLNLPFFSQGGTSLLLNFACIGILFNIALSENREAELKMEHL